MNSEEVDLIYNRLKVKELIVCSQRTQARYASLDPAPSSKQYSSVLSSLFLCKNVSREQNNSFTTIINGLSLSPQSIYMADTYSNLIFFVSDLAA